MSDETAAESGDAPFTDTDGDASRESAADADAGWVDVRMTDPEEGEWDVDVVVAGGRVEYVDLRIRPSLLASFVDCLVDDVDDEHAARILQRLAERNDLPLDGVDRDGSA